MLKYLIPRISRSELGVISGFAVVGSVLAGLYGIVHDQISYTISPEYFTKFKFKQFAYADFGFANRIFVAEIGVLATWWVGFVIAWFLARRLIPNQSIRTAKRQIWLGFAIVFGSGLLLGTTGYLYGLWIGPDADLSSWRFDFWNLNITDGWAL